MCPIYDPNDDTTYIIVENWENQGAQTTITKRLTSKILLLVSTTFSQKILVWLSAQQTMLLLSIEKTAISKIISQRHVPSIQLNSCLLILAVRYQIVS